MKEQTTQSHDKFDTLKLMLQRKQGKKERKYFIPEKNLIIDKFMRAAFAFLILSGSMIECKAQSVNLANYVRVGRYNLPEPVLTTPPDTISLLAQEASAVTYNWDSNTLFVVGDGGTSIVQVSKTGALINSMTLAAGSSPQGTEFYDPEGLAYIGSGMFVMTEERDRNAVKFTYTAGTTLIRANTQTVKLGTTIGNIGLEGVTYDPMTSGFIFVKETTPQGIFQTNIDFNAGTATNGSPTTVNSINLFNPALANTLDFADVFALSNLPNLIGQPNYGNLLVLSQESGQIVNIDRSGNISSTLTIVSDPGNPLTVPNQQHEGLCMDRDSNLYVVSENGGGDFDHPQLWVYAPASTINQAPTAIILNNKVDSIFENTSTASPVKVADIAVTDDGLGVNQLTITGADSAYFQITGTELFIKTGVVLDYETKTSYSINVNVNDTSVGTNPDATVSYILTVKDILIETPPVPSVIISEVAPWSSGNSPVAADWFEVTNTGNSALNISGWKFDDNSNSFASSVTLNGITSIAPGESVIFLETATPVTTIATFKTTWFGANPPTGLQVGSYTGSGVGLSTSADAVNLFNSSGALQANVTFGISTGTAPYRTFNNAAGFNNAVITTLSSVGVNDAFIAINDVSEIGSPGTTGKLFISEVAPWSSGNSPVGADWFEVTNTKGTSVDITGWKMDDNSGSFAASVALNGITSIAPGESVIFLETATPVTTIANFKSNWFGANPPAGIHIGSYTGSGVGLGTGGDAINLYNNTGTLQANIAFGVSPGSPFPTFDNAIGLNNATVSQLSAVGVNGAFIAYNDLNEIGSPGTIVNSPCPAIIVTATQGAAILCNGGTTTDTVTASGGTAPYTGTGAFTISAGTYTYSITDAHGCTGSTTITVTEPPVLTANCSVLNNVSCYGGSNGSVSITGSGGTPPYAVSPSSTGLTAGTYTFTVTDANGCTAACQSTITQPPALNLSITTQNATCGTKVGLAIATVSGGMPKQSPANAYSYLWSNGKTLLAIGALSPGNYTVTVTDSLGCTITGTASIISTAIQSVSVSTVKPNCFGGSDGSACVTGTTGGTGPFSYSWNTVPVQTTICATGLSKDSYQVIITTADGCHKTRNVQITDPAQLIGVATASSANSAVMFAQGGTKPYTYLWSNGQTNRKATGLSNGTYTVTVTDAKGCTVTSVVTIGGSARSTGIDINDAIQSLNVFPNPTADKITILFNSIVDQNYILNIVDNTGKVVYNKTGTAIEGENTIDFSFENLSKGIYAVNIITNDALLTTRIIVK
ncbi:MAG: SdiA-regulated domain-containing protein [Bacteroidia bacterium]